MHINPAPSPSPHFTVSIFKLHISTPECGYWVNPLPASLKTLLAREPRNLWVGSGLKPPVTLAIPSNALALYWHNTSPTLPSPLSSLSTLSSPSPLYKPVCPNIFHVIAGCPSAMVSSGASSPSISRPFYCERGPIHVLTPASNYAYFIEILLTM